MMAKLPSFDKLPRRLLGSIRRRASRIWSGETPDTYFDLNQPQELAKVFDSLGVPQADGQGGDSIRVSRIFDFREDLRTLFPLGFTPQGRRNLLTWLLSNGIKEYKFTANDCLAFLRELDRTPDRGLVRLYLIRPDWQRDIPDALTPVGWPKFLQYLRAHFGLAGRWSRRVRLPQSAMMPIQRQTRGVNVLAHFRYASGLQEAAFGIVNAIKRAGLPLAKRDLPVTYDCDWSDHECYYDLEQFDTTIYVAAANTFPEVWYPRAGLYARPGVRRIAVWYWELEDVPAEWHEQLRWADEVWAPTNFIADAFRKCVQCPVRTILPGIERPRFTPKSRSELGLPEGKFLFLFSFDMGSVMVRKNPLALIRAFRNAFRPEDNVHLVIKVSRGEFVPEDLAVLQAAANAPGIQLINRVMPRNDVLALLNLADCYVSPHRSEGLGLGLAESMLLGKPAIATGYSGNLDFMTNETSYLIDYSMVPVEPSRSIFNPYPAGARWAEPNSDHLTKLLRQVYDNPDEAKAKGLMAKAHIEKVMSLEAYSQRIRQRLDEIHQAAE
ncbi:MAG: glycosyltransferase family 4 protein [Gemmataceae bacterium]